MAFDPNTPRSRDEVLLQAIVSGDSSMMGDPRDREEEFVKAIADKETLPDYSEASNGDVLQIGADGPEWGAIPNELPAIAAGDAGKVLKVNSGETGVEWGAAGGGTKYLHHIRYIVGSTDMVITFDFVSENSTEFSESSIRTALWDKYGNKEIPCSGSVYTNGNYGEVYSFKFTSATSDPTYYYFGVKISDMSKIKSSGSTFGYSQYTIKDVVEEI